MFADVSFWKSIYDDSQFYVQYPWKDMFVEYLLCRWLCNATGSMFYIKFTFLISCTHADNFSHLYEYAYFKMEKFKYLTNNRISQNLIFSNTINYLFQKTAFDWHNMAFSSWSSTNSKYSTSVICSMSRTIKRNNSWFVRAFGKSAMF